MLQYPRIPLSLLVGPLKGRDCDLSPLVDHRCNPHRFRTLLHPGWHLPRETPSQLSCAWIRKRCKTVRACNGTSKKSFLAERACLEQRSPSLSNYSLLRISTRFAAARGGGHWGTRVVELTSEQEARGPEIDNRRVHAATRP